MTACPGTQNERKCSDVIDLLAFPLLLLIKCKYTKLELLILHRFYKQTEIACILLFGVLEGLRGALRQSRFASCFKTTARIKIRRLHVTFVALVPVGGEIAFRVRSDLQVAQNEFFQNR